MNTTTVQPRPAPSLDSRELRDFLCNEARRSGYSEDQVRQVLTDDYGCPERGMRAIQAALAEDEAIMAREFPPGREPIKLGRKPNTGEQVTFAQLREDLWIRVWGGVLDHCFHFDFVNGERRYMRTPSDVEIYAEAIGGNPGGRVLSIEASIEAAKARSSELAVSMQGARDDSQVDPDWETYVILEGTRLRIKQSHQPDRFLSIPVRTPQEANLVLQPWQ
ncbi:hypothetical protein JOM56_010860 [Amanita muscaria]